MSEVIDNTVEDRFELIEEGKLAFADYIREGDVLTLSHVEADTALRGKGTAGRLMEGLLELVRQRHLKVTPVCGYAVAYIQRHPQYADLLAS